MPADHFAIIHEFLQGMQETPASVTVSTKKPPANSRRQVVLQGVAKGARTLDLQSHNLALYPTEL